MNENRLKHIASEYVRQYGEELHRELRALEQNEAAHITPALDRRVRREISALKRRKYSKYLGLIAACFIFALIAPLLFFHQQRELTPTEPSHGSVSETQPLPAPAPAPVPSDEILPLSFTLPGQFTVANVEQDYEKTVYYLQNSELDDVVMTLEYWKDTSVFDGLTSLTIDGNDVFGSSGGGYSLLIFEKQDILYTLTCKHDINTLVRLSKSIFI